MKFINPIGVLSKPTSRSIEHARTAATGVSIDRSPETHPVGALPTWCKRSKMRPKKDAWQSQWNRLSMVFFFAQALGVLSKHEKISREFYGFLHISSILAKTSHFWVVQPPLCRLPIRPFPEEVKPGSKTPRNVSTASGFACSQSCTTFSKKTLEMEVNKARSLRHPPSWHVTFPT